MRTDPQPERVQYVITISRRSSNENLRVRQRAQNSAPYLRTRRKGFLCRRESAVEFVLKRVQEA